MMQSKIPAVQSEGKNSMQRRNSAGEESDFVWKGQNVTLTIINGAI